MADETTNWDDIFRPGGVEPARPAPAAPVSVEPVSPQFPTARLSDPFAVAAAEATATAALPIQRPAGPPQAPGLVPTSRREALAGEVGGRRPEKKKRGKGWVGWLIALVTVFSLIIGGGLFVWT
ncbi:MAG: hypothetical protein AB7K08_14840, partial [Microbacteriaceae bacterium]